MKSLTQPFVQISDSSGLPISQGLLYVGIANQNPESNPQVVFWDSAGTQPAAQPVVLTNGHVSRDGKIAELFIQNDYSITVRTKKGALVFSKLSVSNNNTLAGGVAGAVVYQSAPDVTAFTAAGVLNQVLVSNGASSPTWTDSPQVVTQLRSDASQKAASTQFVRSLGPANSKLIMLTAGVTLVVADVGAFVNIAHTVGSPTITLPSAVDVPAGLGFEFSCSQAAPSNAVVAISATTPLDKISKNGVLLGSYRLTPGSSLRLISNGLDSWFVQVSSKPSFFSAPAGFDLSMLSGPIDIPHFLPHSPSIGMMGVICLVAEHGYQPGDRIPSPLNVAGALTIAPCVMISALRFAVSPGSSIWYVVPKTGGTPQMLTNTSWGVYLYCE